MSSRTKRGSARAPDFFDRVAAESLGLLLIGLALLGTLALASYSPADPLFALEPVMNRAGAFGATLAGLLHGALGPGGFVVVALCAIVGGRLLLGRGIPPLASRLWLGVTLLLPGLAPLPRLLATVAPTRFATDGAGIAGEWLAGVEMTLFSSWGALIVSGMLVGLGLLNVLGISAAATAGAIATASAATGRVAALGARRIAALARGFAGQVRGVGVALRESVSQWPALLGVWRERRARRARVAAQVAQREIAIAPGQPARAAPADASSAPAPRPRKGGYDPDIVDHSEERKKKGPKQESFSFNDRGATGPFQLPDISIFNRPPDGPRTYDRQSLIMNSRILEKKLQDFGISGRVVTVHPGPVITMYEYEPASGIKVNRIVSLADDLALAMRALSVRIIAPLPGKSVVGIEVPNPEREIVYIRDLLESESFRNEASRLTIALGKDIFGNPVEANLARMPHLLVAGATGTGKSVFLNTLLCSILYRASPQDLRLLLVDPKLLELSIYEGIPHLIADVVTNPKRAAAALAGIVHKMEERYRMMQALEVRSIDQFNARVAELRAKGEEVWTFKKKAGEEEAEEFTLEHLPYILVVIDELADLMVVSARDVEEALQRLAQMARAAGIHLVLATQRPSVDVLTGIIKANFPARISFQVSSRTDSRTILDQNGAEHLLGQGDMLFLPPGTSKLQRVHGSYVSEKEVGELARFLREQGKPVFDETLIRLKQESEARETRGEDVDEMYDKAIAIVAESRNASISYIQRRLKVGYNRAARMIEQMEVDQIIGPQDGTKAREVFVQPLDLE